MPKIDDYRQTLSKLRHWTPYLLKNSGLPGPRGNLELAQAVAEAASKEQIQGFLSIPPDQAPENSAEVFLVFCGVAALGKLAARGDRQQFLKLQLYASDSRWRVREAVAIALQYVGDADIELLLTQMQLWSGGNWYEKRAAAAALAEPRLLKDAAIVRKLLRIFDGITEAIASSDTPRSEAFNVLRQSMGCC